MGLDMYLLKRVRHYRKANGTLSRNGRDVRFDNYGRSNAVVEQTMAAYWRKANQIHGWFVDNVCGGKDDCKEHDVSIDDLKELRSVCVKVLESFNGVLLEIDPKEKENYLKWLATLPEKSRKEYADTDIVFRWSEKKSMRNVLRGVSHAHVISSDKLKVAKSLLPTTVGFFFGSTEYNGCYIQDLVATVKMIDEALADVDNTPKDAYKPDFVYSASW